jgi:hypothetical protein
MASRSPDNATRNRVAIFLQTHKGFWCNICIEAATGIPATKPIHELTRKLGKAHKYYERMERVSCSGCERTMTCIRCVA